MLVVVVFRVCFVWCRLMLHFIVLLMQVAVVFSVALKYLWQSFAVVVVVVVVVLFCCYMMWEFKLCFCMRIIYSLSSSCFSYPCCCCRRCCSYSVVVVVGSLYCESRHSSFLIVFVAMRYACVICFGCLLCNSIAVLRCCCGVCLFVV